MQLHRIVLGLLALGAAPTWEGAAEAAGEPQPSATSMRADRPIRAQARRPLAFILSAPSGGMTQTSSSEIIRIVSELIEGHTGFFLEITDALVVTDCQGSMSCLATRVRPDVATPAPPRFLLVLSHVAVPGQGDRLSAGLIDLEVALEVLAGSPREQPGWAREADGAIIERASLLDAERASVDNPIAARAFLERLLFEKLRHIWARTGDWEPFGGLEVRSRIPDAAITLDGRTVGTTRAGVTRVENVEHGARQLSIEHPRYEPFVQQITVERGALLKLEVELIPKETDRSLVYTGAVWGGAALATAGTAIVVYALARHDGGVHSACFRGADEACAGARQFETVSYDPGAVDDARDVNPSGALVAPLGYSLVATGLVWSVGSMVFGEREQPPWLALGIGVAAGLLSYGLSAALDGGPE